MKSVDIHPTEPWVLSSLYNGHVYLWNYSTQELVKTFEVTDLPGAPEACALCSPLRLNPRQSALPASLRASSG